MIEDGHRFLFLKNGGYRTVRSLDAVPGNDVMIELSENFIFFKASGFQEKFIGHNDSSVRGDHQELEPERVKDGMEKSLVFLYLLK